MGNEQKTFTAHSLQHFMNQSDVKKKLTIKPKTTKKRKYSELITINLSDARQKKTKKAKKCHRVRVDSQQNSLKYFWTKEAVANNQKVQKRAVLKPECVGDLISMIDKNCDSNLKQVFERNVFVGCIDSNNSNQTFQRVLFQFDTKLFLCDIHRISRVYFFELCVKNIGHFKNVFSLQSIGDSDMSIFDFVMLGLELDESDYSKESNMRKNEVAKDVVSVLCKEEIAQILADYFCIVIDTKNEKIDSIPSLIDGYIPPLLYLPIFLLRLVTEIRWYKNGKIQIDKHLFQQISMEIARFYQIRPAAFYIFEKEEKKKKKFGGYFDGKNDTNKQSLEWILQHVIFRSMNAKCSKYSFNPPRFLNDDGSIVRIACTKQLYKVFERC